MVVLAGEAILQSRGKDLVLDRRLGRPVNRDALRHEATRGGGHPPTDVAPMRLLTSYLKMLDAENTIETPEAAHLAALHVHDLAALALGASRDAMAVAGGRGARAARLETVKQYILAHLAEPDLSVATVAARHALSPRYIHKLFELEGTTYSEFVVARRLGQAHRC